MQLGMVGLGRMGANLVRRLHPGRARLRRATTSVPTPSARSRRRGRTGALARELVASSTAPRAVWVMVPAGVSPRGRSPSSPRCSSRATRSSTAATPTTATTSTRAKTLRDKGIHYSTAARRRRVRPGARLLPDDRRRGRRGRRGWRRSSRTHRARASMRATAHAGPRRRPGAGRAGLAALRPAGRRPLRQDGAQRHRVRADGRVRRGPEHPRQRRRRHRAAHRPTPRPRR